MAIELPPLPYALNALEPHISKETLEYHHGKHHQTYVTNTNNLLKQSPLEGKSLETIIKEASGPLFNNAAQVWNHSFYWNCLSPQGGGEPTGTLAKALLQSFGSFTQFKEEFTKTALATFGSGWAWLVANPDKTLAIISTSNAQTPLNTPQKPLLTCDVWEHAYYIDYRNARANYVEAFWNLVHWDFVTKQYI